MKIAVWQTGHEIADTVAIKGFQGSGFHQGDMRVEKIMHTNGLAYASPSEQWIKKYDAHIGYGILRGMDDVFKQACLYNKHWFNIDRGYFNPGHFEGYYRISYKGTQAKWHNDIPQQDIDFELEEWCIDKKHILVCPPTEAVCEFFRIDYDRWIRDNVYPHLGKYHVSIRTKDCVIPLRDHLKNCAGIITFNSSIGWQALQRGIPVYSDPDHSIIGSYYKAKLKNPIDFLSDEYRAVDREPLFRAMRAHQFTLEEIAQGKAWALLRHYLTTSSSGMIAGKQ